MGKKSKKDTGGTVRDFPGPYGPMISPNYDLGDGPYSQNNGKPFGGLSVRKYIEKQRKKRRKAKDKVMAKLDIFTRMLYKYV